MFSIMLISGKCVSNKRKTFRNQHFAFKFFFVLHVRICFWSLRTIFSIIQYCYSFWHIYFLKLRFHCKDKIFFLIFGDFFAPTSASSNLIKLIYYMSLQGVFQGSAQRHIHANTPWKQSHMRRDLKSLKKCVTKYVYYINVLLIWKINTPKFWTLYFWTLYSKTYLYRRVIKQKKLNKKIIKDLAIQRDVIC